jgi:hypothetical protein
MQLCYDGSAFQQVLKLPSTPEQRTRAVLALSRHDCLPPTRRPSERQELRLQHTQLLDRVNSADLAALPPTLQNRLHLRRAGVWAAVAFEQSEPLGVLRISWTGNQQINEDLVKAEWEE